MSDLILMKSFLSIAVPFFVDQFLQFALVRGVFSLLQISKLGHGNLFLIILLGFYLEFGVAAFLSILLWGFVSREVLI